MKKVRNYLTGVVTELRKVTFPSRDEVMQMTSLVISVCLALAVLVGVLDFAFRNVIKWLVA